MLNAIRPEGPTEKRREENQQHGLDHEEKEERVEYTEANEETRPLSPIDNSSSMPPRAGR